MNLSEFVCSDEIFLTYLHFKVKCVNAVVQDLRKFWLITTKNSMFCTETYIF